MIASRRDGELICVGGLLRFWDDQGNRWIEIHVAVDMGAAVARLDAALHARERRQRQKRRVAGESCFSALEDDTQTPFADTIADRSRPIPRIRLLVGFSAYWPGPPPPPRERRRMGWECPCCHGRELAPIAACLYCDRTGLDGTPLARSDGPVADLPAADDDALAGGVGGAPKPKPVKAPKPEPGQSGWMNDLNRLRAERAAARAARKKQQRTATAPPPTRVQ